MKRTVETVKLAVIRGRIESMSEHTITEFLLARIAEDEAVAQAVEDGPRWAVDEESYVVMSGDDGICYDVASGEVSQHIARHDPDRILAECAAKRAVITSYASCKGAEAATDITKEFGVKLTVSGMVKGLELAVKHLAAVYADHPDYRREWAL